MKPLFVKELRQYFGNLTGFLSIALFLIIMGLFLFVFPDTSILDFGYASLDQFFNLAPWVLLLLVPAVTMRSFSEEFKSGTWETLKTKPLSIGQIVAAKWLASLVVVLLALLPTLLYVVTIKELSINGSIDSGAIVGSYIGLVLLVGTFTAIGICCSALTSNAIVSFLMAAFVCFILNLGFSAIAAIPQLQGGPDYWIGMFGIDEHYKSISRGILAMSDLLYFAILMLLFFQFTKQLVARR